MIEGVYNPKEFSVEYFVIPFYGDRVAE